MVALPCTRVMVVACCCSCLRTTSQPFPHGDAPGRVAELSGVQQGQLMWWWPPQRRQCWQSQPQSAAAGQPPGLRWGLRWLRVSVHVCW